MKGFLGNRTVHIKCQLTKLFVLRCPAGAVADSSKIIDAYLHGFKAPVQLFFY